MQAGFMSAKPPGDGQEDLMKNLLEGMKTALSLTLVHFYPLAACLVTKKEENSPSYFVFVDYNNSPRAKLIQAAVDMTVSDIIFPKYMPSLVRSFFDHDGAVNYDGHTRALLSIQVTELIDGIFIGYSMNHAIGDGISLWHFTKAVAGIFEMLAQLSRPPMLERWFPEGYSPLINLRFTHYDGFIRRLEVPQVLERIFHFSSKFLAKLKARANSKYNTSKISSFQSLSALVWRSITKARCFPHDHVVLCKLAIDNRSRMEPHLSLYYFGNAIQTVRAMTTAGELLEQSLGWATWQLLKAVANHNDKSVRDFVDKWLCSPFMHQLSETLAPNSILLASSPRFNKYENEFGLGKTLRILSGYSHKFDRKKDAFPGFEGGGSIDLTVCLQPDRILKEQVRINTK